ncbi:hypothetical protein GOODEAATRI_019340 [Goodea atripinnis]|uniref:Uncharacterized protein n=1 Tax=Goodea atripinnis TaxID=208336 RepID=A0ABV0NBW1_9TELE
MQGELADNLGQLQELKDVLQRTQTISDQRQAQVDKLSVRLSETQRELDKRTLEVLDMDNVLKERQGELQQRAKLESEEFSQQLRECQQRLNKVLEEHEACQRHHEALTRELDATKLQIRETLESLQHTRGQLLKESEVTRLQARISSMGRAAERQSLHSHAVSLPPLHTFTDPLEFSCSAHPSQPSPKWLQTPVPSSSCGDSVPRHSPTNTQPCLSPPANSYPQSNPAPHLSESLPPCDWLQSSSINSSMNLTPSLKATLRVAVFKQPWESSSPSVSTFPETADHSWKGLSATEASAMSDGSFNPLTYMVDTHNDTHISMEALTVQQGEDVQHSESRRETGSTSVEQEEEEVDLSSLTGMLKFVNQTLAMQEDPSAWSSTKKIQT